MLAFVVPAHNEELFIGRTLASLHAAARAVCRPCEIIVVDDASTDRTTAVAAEHRARVVSIQARQIAAARNAGARAALQNPAAYALLFVDADTVVPTETLQAALARGVAGGGATVQFDGPVPRWASLTLAAFLIVFRLLRWSGGCFIFCSREAFEATGGWNERVFAGEELYMSQALKRHGRFVVLREPVITSGRKARAHSARDVFTSLARLGLRGPAAVRDRKRLELWYGPRRGGY